MYEAIVHTLQSLKPGNMLLVQAVIIVFFPYCLWRYLKFDRIFPLGVVQIFSGVLLGPAIFGLLDEVLLNTMTVTAPSDPKAFNACQHVPAKALWESLFGMSCFKGQVVNRAAQIGAVATIAVCMFGFLAGAEADKKLISQSGKSVFSIGLFGMLFGWALGIAAGSIIYYAIPESHGTGPKVNVFSFSIAYGLVIAVSALPVLALILRGLDLTKQRLGAVALASAGIADTIMWLGLGLVVALTLEGSLLGALLKAVSGGVLSIGFIKLVATPVFERMYKNEAPESAIITFAALSIFVASAITSITELHPVLGAFVAGFFLPDKVRETALHRFDQVTVLVLMPFFFLNTGLNTRFSFGDPNVWILFFVSSVLCVVGKMAGHGLAARMAGENWPFSAGVGLLLQTKGLMGIIVIVVFLEKDVISPLMYAAAVFMCMFSTGLPTPVMRKLIAKYGTRITVGDQAAAPILAEPGPVVSQAAVAAAAAAASPPMAKLVFEDSLGTFDVTRGAVTIGRHSEDDIRINDVRVSRRHARLTVAHDGRFEIVNLTRDRSVSNPITVNGVEHEQFVLSEGDKVVLGGGPAFTVRYAAKKAA